MSETLNNLAKAFIGESQARNRYTFYASAARKEGYEQIASIFSETADQEKEHAKKLFDQIQLLKGEAEEIKVEAEVPTVLGTTAENLKAAISGENHEHTSMYPGFADKADEEGNADAAKRMRSIAVSEKHHEERYQKLLEQVEAGTIFKKSEETSWICRECGYEHTGTEAPQKCPSCDHPQSFYQVKCEKY